MAYEIHNFQKGQILTANSLNEMDMQISENAIKSTTQYTTSITDLNNCINEGQYYFPASISASNMPNGMEGCWLDVRTVTYNGVTRIKQIAYRYGAANITDFETYVRTFIPSSEKDGVWSDWHRLNSDIKYDIFQYVIVDSENGDDTKGCIYTTAPTTELLSTRKSFKTLDSAFALLNNGITNLVIDIISAGDYILSNSYVNCCTIHLRGRSNNITISNKTNNNIVFYNCHINFHSYVESPIIISPISGMFYTENCGVSLTNIKFNGTCTSYGDTWLGHRVSCNNLCLDASNGNLEDITITRTNQNVNGDYDLSSDGDGILLCNSSQFVIKSSLSFANLTSTGSNNAAIRVSSGSVCTLLTYPTKDLNTKYSYGIRVVNALLLATAETVNQFANVGNTIKLIDGATIYSG